MAGILAAVVGLTPRQLRDLVDERGIPHETWRRHVYVRVEDVVRALGLAGMSAPASSSPRPTLTEAEVIELASRPGRAR